MFLVAIRDMEVYLSTVMQANTFLSTLANRPASHRRRTLRQDTPFGTQQTRAPGVGELLGLQQVSFVFLSSHKYAHPSSRHVLKTNFYQPTKVALSFRLAPGFLPDIEYPWKPYGMFIIIGACWFCWSLMGIIFHSRLIRQ